MRLAWHHSHEQEAAHDKNTAVDLLVKCVDFLHTGPLKSFIIIIPVM